MSAVLECVNVHFRIGSLEILNGVDFSVSAGEICGIVGPNGSGKSTLLNVISGFASPQVGQVMLKGDDVTTAPAWRRARSGLGRTFQLVRVVETATAVENVEAGLLTKPRSPRPSLFAGRARTASRVSQALARVQVAEFADWPVRYLSFGSRRKVEIARAIVGEPRVLLVDEPTSGVSRAHILEIERVLREEAERGCAVVVVDHNLDFIRKLAPRVVVLDAGNEVFAGSPDDAFADPAVIAAYLGK
jgi:ABC-type branched-subunit amino acid transport system ATPase component